MFSLSYMKKKSLLMFFLCVFFLLPSAAGAINDPEGLLVKHPEGSKYNTVASSGVGTGIGGVPTLTTSLVDLFSDDKLNPKISNTDFLALKRKLIDNKHPYGQNFEEGRVWRGNSGDVSVFMYKNNDGTLIHLAYATRQGNFYTAATDSNKTQIQNNTDLARKALNIVDESEGRAKDTTIEEMSKFGNTERDRPLLQEKVNEAQKLVDAAEEKLKNLIANNASAEEIQKAKEELDTAREKLRDENNNLTRADQILGERNDLVAAQKKSTKIECGFTEVFSGSCILTWVSYLTNFIFKFVSWAAYVVGILFDYSLELSINSAEFFKKLGVVELTWSFIRDILNMTFIFILLFTAVQILIGNDSKYNAKKILINVIIFAILMNFSLFAAKLMVDGSNVVSLKLYEAMKVSSKTGESSISLRVMDTLGVQKIFEIRQIFGLNQDNNNVTGVCNNDPSSLITMHLLGSIMLIVISLALGLAAILFLIRLVNIIFLFIRSPLWIWGYVIPGNSSMNSISSKWWQEMKHVLFFPIMYLFQMLIALIVFSKLGDVQDGKMSLLDLICNPPSGASGAGSVISLIAIFCIVIMFLMKAISYGVKHSGDGGEGALGNKWASAASSKFAGFQTKMTTGLAKKAGMASVGAANRGIKLGKDLAVGTVKRTGGTLLGAAAGGFNRDGVWKGAAEGFFNPGVYGKEQLAKVTGRAANFSDKYMLGIGSKKLADATNSMTENAAKERKAVYEKRTKKDGEKETSLQKSAAITYKPYTQKEWEHKNGEIGTDTTKAAEYEQHIKEMLEKQADARLGKGIIKLNNKDRVKHLDALMEKAVKTEMVDGKLKVKINSREVSSSFKDIAKYDTRETQAITKKGWKVLFRTERAEAQLKALDKSFDEEIRNNDGEKAIKDLEEAIKKSAEKLKNLPEDKILDDILSNISKGTSTNIITGDSEKYPEIREYNNLIKRRTDIRKRITGRSTPEEKIKINDAVYEIEQKLIKQVELIQKTKSNITEKIVKDREAAAKKEEAKDKKDK